MPQTEAAEGSAPQLGRVHDLSGRPRYVLERLLDEGGSEGRVFLATDVDTNDVVALKQFTAGLVHGQVGRDLGERLRMLRGTSLQLRAVRGLVGYLDPFEGFVPDAEWAPRGWWLPMEYVAGDSLQDLMRQGLDDGDRLKILEGLRMVATTLEELAGLHPPVAHRDVKPANIVVRPVAAGRVECVLVDIGLMARADQQHFSRVGSNGYMAPELLDGHHVRGQELHLADWYSFTALLFAVVARKAPPAAPERWRDSLAGVPARAGRALVRAGTAAPLDRPQPTTLLDSLVTALTEDHQGAQIVGRERSRLWIGAAAVVVVAAALITAVVWSGGRQPSAADQPLSSTSDRATSGAGATQQKPTSPTGASSRSASGPVPPAAGGFLAFSKGSAEHACAVDASRRLYCWGNDNAGQLGDESTQTRGEASQVVGISDVTQVAVGGSTTCAISTKTGLMCWGDNGQGQLGDGTTKTRFLPTAVKGLTDVQEVAVGRHQTCARTAPGDVFCWGSADNSSMEITRPAKVVGLKPAASIAVGMDHACALDRDGAVWCWGSNGAAQFGDGGPSAGGPSFTLIPQRIEGVPPARSITAGPLSTYALTTKGLYGWGADDNGRLGVKALVGKLPPPVAIPVPDVVAVAPGEDHACALTSTGSVYCFGANRMGQIGDGTTTQRNTPSLVRHLAGAEAITAGDSYSCALNGQGRPVCWGSHDDGSIAVVYDRPIDLAFADPHAPPMVGGGM